MTVPSEGSDSTVCGGSSSGVGAPMTIAAAVMHLSSEDYYRSEPLAFLRMATAPNWDYYQSIYG